jgi:hypothetical protein
MSSTEETSPPRRELERDRHEPDIGNGADSDRDGPAEGSAGGARDLKPFGYEPL